MLRALTINSSLSSLSIPFRIQEIKERELSEAQILSFQFLLGFKLDEWMEWMDKTYGDLSIPFRIQE